MTSTTKLNNALVIVHGNRMEDLRDLMLSWLQIHPLAPLTPEVILVQSNGMKQWLVQSMAIYQGVSAGVELYLPSDFLWRAYRQVLGNQQVPKQMAFDKSPLTWRVYRLLAQVLTDENEVYQPLRHYLSPSEQSSERRFQLAAQIADLYDQYQTYRADWIAHWSNGLNELINQQGELTPLNAQTWQASLWRVLQDDICRHGQSLTSRASVHEAFMQQMQHIQQGESKLNLPERIVVFGVSSLPQQTLEALSAMSRVSQVLLFVNNPCRYYWGDVQDSRYWRRKQLDKAHRHAIKQGLTLAPLQEDYASFQPLLASWGKQGKDYIQLLNEFDEVSSYQQWFQRVDMFVEPSGNDKLSMIQQHILNLTPPPDTPMPHDALDESICLRSGYSAQREVEMLHDHLLALFDAHAELTPADVMVMVPDVDQFAAAISAVFGRISSNDKRYIPYAIADTNLRIEPMMQCLEWLLTLTTADIGLSDWHAMFELDAVRAKFKLSEADVALLHQWLLKAGVRWGIDAKDRSQRHDLPEGVEANSWFFGLERLLLGYATGEMDHTWQAILPCEAASGSSAELLGALAQWIESIRIAQSLLSVETTPVIWGDYLETLLQLFFDEQNDIASQRWLTQFRSGLQRWLTACELGQFEQKLPLSVVAKAWLENIDDSQSLQRPFLSGGVQFATLMPMRAIPFKVICLLGLNERDYPRQQVKQDFDLMALTSQWRAGDRSRRHDDRYLFLEAILSARMQVYLSWTGRSMIDDQHRAPSILVSQFIDYCHQLFTPPLNVQQHPLQPFSESYQQVDSPLRTYAIDWFAANASIDSQHHWVNGVLPEKAIPAELSVTRLNKLLRHPQKVLLQDRLQTKLTQPESDQSDDEVFELTALQQHYLTQQPVDQWLREAAASVSELPWRYTGVLPLAGFAQLDEQQLQHATQQLWQNWQSIVDNKFTQQEALTLELGLQQTTLSGRIALVYAHNESSSLCALQLVAGSLIKDKVIKSYKLTEYWLSHCLANACGYALTSFVVSADAKVSFKPIDATQARLWLQEYLALYQQAWQQPLKVACKSGIAYVQSLQQQQAKRGNKEGDEAGMQAKALTEARKAFEGGSHGFGEREESLELQRCFATFDELQPEFTELAQQLYGVMLERVVTA